MFLTSGSFHQGCNNIFCKFHKKELNINFNMAQSCGKGAQWLSGRVFDSRPRGQGFEPHRHHCVVSLSKNINPSLVPVQPRKTCPFTGLSITRFRGRNSAPFPMPKSMFFSQFQTKNSQFEKKKFFLFFFVFFVLYLHFI